jgi:hypothetical protein
LFFPLDSALTLAVQSDLQSRPAWICECCTEPSPNGSWRSHLDSIHPGTAIIPPRGWWFLGWRCRFCRKRYWVGWIPSEGNQLAMVRDRCEEWSDVWQVFRNLFGSPWSRDHRSSQLLTVRWGWSWISKIHVWRHCVGDGLALVCSWLISTKVLSPGTVSSVICVNWSNYQASYL